MQKLEEEMQQKFREIEELMNLGGFNKKKTDSRKGNGRKFFAANREIKERTNNMLNKNSNSVQANLKLPISCESKLTIYQNAIQPKGDSSSSDEGGILNSSDALIPTNELIIGQLDGKDAERMQDQHQTSH